MFQIMTMEYVGLIAVKIVGEVHGKTNGFARPDQHGILPSEVAHDATAAMDAERADLSGAILA